METVINSDTVTYTMTREEAQNYILLQRETLKELLRLYHLYRMPYNWQALVFACGEKPPDEYARFLLGDLLQTDTAVNLPGNAEKRNGAAGQADEPGQREPLERRVMELEERLDALEDGWRNVLAGLGDDGK